MFDKGDTHARSSHRRATGQRDDRQSHPERVERGDGAVVGEGVEADVELMIAVEVSRPRDAPGELDPIRADSPLKEQRPHCLQVSTGLRMNDQARARQRLQDGKPHPQRRLADLGEVVQAAEGDEAITERGQRGNGRRFFGRLVAPVAVGKPYRTLGVIAIAGAGGVEIPIAQTIVDRRQPGRGDHAEHGHLNGRWLAGKDQQPIVARVQRQVDQDVDPVGTDLIGHLEVGKTQGRTPNVRQGLELLGVVVARPHVGVGDEFGLAAIVMRKQRQQRAPDGMTAEIRRDEPDP